MKHWVQRYNRFSERGFSTIWQYNLFTEDFFLWFAKVLILTSQSLIHVSWDKGKKNIGLVTKYGSHNLHSTISMQYCESSFFVHGTEKKCNGACKERSVYRAALERGKKQPINCTKETLASRFLQGTCEGEEGKKERILKENIIDQKFRQGQLM